MDVNLLFKGLLLGFVIAAPVGPIGVLCIRRSLAQGKLYGFVSGLGAATADAMYGSIAGFGLSFITTFLIDQKLWFQLIGGCFLCYLGVSTLRSRPAEHAAQAKGDGLLQAYTTTLFLTVTNPMTILFFISVFAGLGMSTMEHSSFSAFMLVAGVFVGSALWWLLLSTGVGLFKNKMNLKSLIWINWISGLILLGFGLFGLYVGLLL
ncbi:LysE family translocator [Ectobacillus sp. sgz5001026]|uniref:LysE family translocator n=1 Tax=Ectobacillus sp. sgz5001026 TaxID=3242473 RepID=UPI0036D32B8C